MTLKPLKVAGVFLILLVLLLSAVSVEARTFRKAVSQSPESTVNSPQSFVEKQTPNSEPQTANSPTGFQTFSNPLPTTQNSQPIANTIVILNTNDVTKTKEAVNLIRNNGGIVSIVYIPNTLVVLKLPANVESTLVSKYGATISKSGIPNGAAPALVNALTAPQASSLKPQAVPHEFKEGPVEIAPDLKDRIMVPPGSSGYPPPSDPTRTSEYMIGDVFVSVILPESDGTLDPNEENWNATEETIVDQQVTNALNWWVARSTERSVSYTLTFWTYPQHYKINTGYEPSHRNDSDDYLWINQVLDKMGVAPAGDKWTRVRNYDNFLRTSANGTYDWAFTIFVADASTDNNIWLNVYAYGGGPYEVVAYDYAVDQVNQNWLGTYIAHESGHIFWADDQYPGGGRVCTDKSGILQVENQNLKEVGCLSDVESIMRNTAFNAYNIGALDPYGAGQLGWRDLDSDSVTDSIDITYNTWDIDTDNDQTINYWDIDDDNDGIGDVSDACKLSAGWSSAQGCSPVNLTVSSDKASIQIGEVVRITASGVDNFKVATLSIYIDGTNQSGTVCSGIGTTSANCYKDLSYGSAGTHNFYSTSTDDNNLTTTATQSFTVQPDSGNPTVSVTAAATVQVNNPIRITSSATDNIAVSSISIFVDGVSQTGLTCSGLGTTSANCYKDLTYSTLGSHTYYSTATDSSSNTARDPVSGTKSFSVVDTTNPTVSVTGPASPVNIGQTITITGTASDNYQLSEIVVYLDGAPVRTCNGGATSCDFQTLFGAPGTHNYYATAKDSSGNSAQSTTKSFVVGDNIAPTFTEPITVNAAGSSVTITAKAADNIQLADIKIFLDGAQIKTCIINAGSGQCDYSASLTYGTHKTYAVATDSSGNIATHPEKVFELKDNIPPNVALSIGGDEPSEGKKLTFTATATDDSKVARIEIYRNSNAKSPVKTCNVNAKSGSCTYNTNWGVVGRNGEPYVVAVDEAGNKATGRR